MRHKLCSKIVSFFVNQVISIQHFSCFIVTSCIPLRRQPRTIIKLSLHYLTLARSTSGEGTPPQPLCCICGCIRGVTNFHCVTCIVSNQTMENHSDVPTTKRTRLQSTVEAVATGAQSAATGTDAASSAIGPVVSPERNTDDTPREVRVQVEAFGSGEILHGGLDIPTNKSVGDLWELVLSSIKLPPRTRGLRLFVGHGGTELDKDDEALLSGSLAAVDLNITPLVALRVQCKSVLWPWCHNSTEGGDASTLCQRLHFVLRGG